MILVTGATGVVGTELVKQLLESGEKFRVLARNPAKAEHLKGRAEIVQGDLEKAETLAAAVDGIDHIFLLTVDQDTDTDVNLITAAKAAGVHHVVKISTNFVVNDPQTALGAWHAKKEKLLIDSGLGWTILRPSGFMSNSFQWLGSIKAQGAVYVPTGTTKGPSIDPADIAAVAKVALTQPGHEGKAYEITGSEMLSTHEQVAILSKVIGKPIKTIDVTVEQAVEGMRKNPHMPAKLVDALGEMLQAIRDGKLSRNPTEDVLKLTGRPAGTFEAWCERHKQAFA
jgi:uncharacterized protein YbjT (DUF2867 family)